MSPTPELKPHFVYRLRDHAGRLLYVGVTWNLLARMTDHASNSRVWFQHVRSIEVSAYATRGFAAGYEADAIRDERPSQNVMGSAELANRAGYALTSIPIDPTMWSTAARIAQVRDESVHELIRSTLQRYVEENVELLDDANAGPFVPLGDQIRALFPMEVEGVDEAEANRGAAS
jgi:predicted GIY-YIG superfamily endonuclease